jgi:hypothetical protein
MTNLAAENLIFFRAEEIRRNGFPLFANGGWLYHMPFLRYFIDRV